MSSEAYRLSYRQCRELLDQRVAEPAPGRIQLLTGPRQVGKTTPRSMLIWVSEEEAREEGAVRRDEAVAELHRPGERRDPKNPREPTKTELIQYEQHGASGSQEGAF